MLSWCYDWLYQMAGNESVVRFILLLLLLLLIVSIINDVIINIFIYFFNLIFIFIGVEPTVVVQFKGDQDETGKIICVYNIKLHICI